MSIIIRVFCAPRGDNSGRNAVYDLLEDAYGKGCGGDFPEIKKTPYGKPYFPEKPEIHFSLSHAQTHVLCAISDSPVGVDIESPRLISQRAIGYFSVPEELTMFDPLDLWVIKESYVKLFGKTIASIRTLRFSRRDDEIIVPDDKVAIKLYHVGDCSAAVSSLGGIPPDSIELVLRIASN